MNVLRGPCVPACAPRYARIFLQAVREFAVEGPFKGIAQEGLVALAAHRGSDLVWSPSGARVGWPCAAAPGAWA